MAGFGSVIGFSFSFLIIITMFVASFTVFTQYVQEQSDLYEDAGDAFYLSSVLESYSIAEPYYSSGRQYFYINNNANEKLFFSKDENFCFSLFISDQFISEDDYKIKLNRSIEANYRAIEPDEIGIFSYRTDSNTVTNSKIISCVGNEKSFIITDQSQDWFDLDFSSRDILNVTNNNPDESIVEYQVEINLNSSNFDFSNFDVNDLRFVVPMKEYSVLDLTFDSYSQNVNDYSSISNSIILGNSSSLESSDPISIDGILYDALRFDGVDDFINITRSSSYVLDNELTINFWYKRNTSSNGDRTFIFDNISKSRLYVENDNSVSFDLNISGQLFRVSSSTNLDASWNMITARFGSDNLSLFIDGQLEDSIRVVGVPEFDIDNSFIGSHFNQNYLSGDLDEFKVFNVELSDLEIELLKKDNLRFRELNFYVTISDISNEEVLIYTKIPYIKFSEDVSIHMYYDNSNSSISNSDIESTFSYKIPRTIGYPISSLVSNSIGLTFMSLYDENTIRIGDDEFNFSQFEIGSLGSGSISNDDPIQARYLTQIEGDGNGGDMIIPVSWASTDFYIMGTRNAQDTFCLFSPWGDASVDIFENGVSVVSTLSVDSNSVVCQQNDTGTSSGVQIISDIPILVSYFGNTGTQDASSIYPASSEELYGVPSQNLRVAAGPLGASIPMFTSDGSSASTLNLGANAGGSDTGNGADGSGPAFRLIPDNLIGATQQGDSDGSEQTVFVPEKEMGSIFGSPIGNEYVVVASPHSDANCSIFNSTNLIANDVGSGQDGIFKFEFGTGNDNIFITEPWYLSCDKPVWPYYERDGNAIDDDEVNLFGHLQMRQYIHPEPTIVFN